MEREGLQGGTIDPSSPVVGEPGMRLYLAVHGGATFALAFATLLASDGGITVGLAAAIVAGLVLGWRLPGEIVLVGIVAAAALVLYGAIGGLLVAYFVGRTRLVGFAREELCYLFAVVGEPGVPLDPSTPDALAAAFRFR